MNFMLGSHHYEIFFFLTLFKKKQSKNYHLFSFVGLMMMINYYTMAKKRNKITKDNSLYFENRNF